MTTTTDAPLALNRAEELLAFHEGSAVTPPGMKHLQVEINAEDFAAILRDVRAARESHRLMFDALSALTDPEGHIWHGGNTECTGECRDVQAAIAAARGATP